MHHACAVRKGNAAEHVLVPIPARRVDKRVTPGIVQGIVGDPSVARLFLGLLLFAAAPTPSLIPRGPAVQGLPGGLAAAVGQPIGQIGKLLWRGAELPGLSGHAAAILGAAIAIPSSRSCSGPSGPASPGRTPFAGKAGMEPAEALGISIVVPLAVASFAAALAMERLLAGPFRPVRAWFHRVAGAVDRDGARVADPALDGRHRAAGDGGQRPKVVGLPCGGLVDDAARRGVDTRGGALATSLRARLARLPLAIAEELDASAVDQPVQRPVGPGRGRPAEETGAK